MTVSASLNPTQHNPLDRFERIAETRSWQIDRTNDHEVVMLVSSGWSNLVVSLTWRDDLECLQLACGQELKVPEKRREEVVRLLAIVNAQLVHGHFDLWDEGDIVFRHSLLLSGGAQANDTQCEAMIQLGLATVHAYHPAFNFVIWAGQTAKQALANAMLETMGEA